MSSGKIVQIIGAVIDVEFPSDAIPKVYDALNVSKDREVTSSIIFYIINFVNLSTLWIYVYFVTKYTNLELYLRSIMFGYRVYQHFDNLSYLITRS